MLTWKFGLLAALSFVLAGAPPRPPAHPPAGSSRPRPDDPPRTKPLPVAPRPRLALGPSYPASCWGTVVAVGTDSITLQEIEVSADASIRERRVVPDQKPRPFRVNDRVSGRAAPPFGFWSGPYQLSDVRVGDVVRLDYLVEDRVEAPAHYLLIYRRPGGRIPPEPTNIPGGTSWQERTQAEQDWEEKGIPLPEKYAKFPPRPPFLDPPYPPVAPMPRELAPRGSPPSGEQTRR